MITLAGMAVVTFAGLNTDFRGSWIVYGMCITVLGILLMSLQALT